MFYFIAILGSGVVTRRPLVLQLVHVKPSRKPSKKEPINPKSKNGKSTPDDEKFENGQEKCKFYS